MRTVMTGKLFWAVVILGFIMHNHPATAVSQESDGPLDEYITFLEEVYETMNKNYYRPVPREAFEQFVEAFRTKIYPQVSAVGKSVDYIKWRSAHEMVNQLRDPQDIFSTFYPPEPAKEYEETALGKRIDLGIEGEPVKSGFKATHVEPRSDAYEKGLRVDDILLSIDGQKTKALSLKKIKELLKPLVDSEVKLTFRDVSDKAQRTITVISEEYFKQTVFMCETPAPGVYCFRIDRFNRKTSEDMMVHLNFIKEHRPIHGLILDLRGNPGGPPLAAREIASFFLPGGEEFAYFQKRGQPKASLDVPTIPGEYKYGGPLAILVNEGSGSSAELFSGILQRRERAVLLGSHTAGQVFLKSMFHFDDESMLLLVTARGHHPDGAVFSFEGLRPNRKVEDGEDVDLIELASAYFFYIMQQ